MGSFSVSFIDEGRIRDQLLLVGGCGAGKSLILDCIAGAWGASISRSGRPIYPLQGNCQVRVDFEINGEVAVISMRGDRADTHSLLMDSWDPVRHFNGVLYYGKERFQRLPTGAMVEVDSAGVMAVWAVLADLHTRGMRDGVLMIDDFDMGLDSDDQKAFWAHLWRETHSLGMQLVVGTRQGYTLSGFKVKLEKRVDPIQVAMKSLAGILKEKV